MGETHFFVHELLHRNYAREDTASLFGHGTNEGLCIARLPLSLPIGLCSSRLLESRAANVGASRRLPAHRRPPVVDMEKGARAEGQCPVVLLKKKEHEKCVTDRSHFVEAPCTCPDPTEGFFASFRVHTVDSPAPYDVHSAGGNGKTRYGASRATCPLQRTSFAPATD